MTLYLLPNLLGPLPNHSLFLPESVDGAVSAIDGLIAESEGEGRRYLKRFATKKKPHEMPMALLTSKKQEIDFLLEPLLKGETWGLISDAGLPCLADPGAALVRRAHHLKIPIVAFPGPSSITHALMLSGLSGQQFTFHGYAHKEPSERAQEFRLWEKSRQMTHIFIEAPYRNSHTFAACLKELQESTWLCVASSLTLPDQWICTQQIRQWRKAPPPAIEKRPMIFLFSS